jgi:hypothetical protein
LPHVPPTYRERLKIEGGWLAALGVAGSAALLAVEDEARRWPLNTVGQLAVATGIIGFLGRRGTRKAIDNAVELKPDAIGSGEPTALWIHPLIVVGLAAIPAAGHLFDIDRAGFDASLRVTGGVAIVGLAQAIVLERMVARAERDKGRRYYRIVGSRGLTTKLGWVRAS